MPDRLGKSTIICICGGIGFPIGTASSDRIRNLGKGIIAAGGRFEVLHLGPSVVAENYTPQGVYSGIRFQYLPGIVKASTRRWIRILCYIVGAVLLPFKLMDYPPGAIAYIYYQGTLAGLWTLAWCRILRLPTVQEACEWWPETKNSNIFVRFMYSKVMFRYSQGALAISKAIEERIRKVCEPSYPIYRLPVLANFEDAHADFRKPMVDIGSQGAYFLWCGSLNAYQEEVEFLIQAFGQFKRKRSGKGKLILVGPASESTRKVTYQYLKAAALEAGDVIIPGFVDESELRQLCRSATALLLPMWRNARSETRFPTKVALYLMTGRPIVTSPVGAIAEFFRDRETALFYNAGIIASLVNAMTELSENQSLANDLGTKAKKEILPNFDLIRHGRDLLIWSNINFFADE